MSLFADAQTHCHAIREKLEALEGLDLAGLDPSGQLGQAVAEVHQACAEGLGVLAGHLNTTVQPLSGGTSKP